METNHSLLRSREEPTATFCAYGETASEELTALNNPTGEVLTLRCVARGSLAFSILRPSLNNNDHSLALASLPLRRIPGCPSACDPHSFPHGISAPSDLPITLLFFLRLQRTPPTPEGSLQCSIHPTIHPACVVLQLYP